MTQQWRYGEGPYRRGGSPGKGDRDLLFQAFANLLDTAVKYTRAKGRIELSLELRQGRPRVIVAG